jgi:hypothetical protein
MNELIQVLMLYVLGFFITADLMLAWFGTDFPAHWLRLGDWEAFRNWCRMKLGSRGFLQYLLGQLLICPICLGHWFAAVVAAHLSYFCGLPWAVAVIGIFSWPLLSFILLKKLGIV